MPSKNTAEYKRRFDLADKTEKWARTMAKVGIRQAVARAKAQWPRWEFVTFRGPHGAEAGGIVDLIAVCKDHADPPHGLKRGGALRIVLIQVKGGNAANPTQEDCERLRIVKRLHNAWHVIFARWKKGEGAGFFSLRAKPRAGAGGWKRDWEEVSNLNAVFR